MNQKLDNSRKTRELQNKNFNSLIWNDFKFRDDDVIVASYPRCGTTWVQQIVGQLIFEGAEDIPIREISPWIDAKFTPPNMMENLEAQVHRRVIKSHLPLDALTFSTRAKYIYVARDGRDAAWSHYDMLVNAKPISLSQGNGGELNVKPIFLDPNQGGQLGEAEPPIIGTPIEWDRDVQRFFRRWLEKDGYPIWPFWEHVRSWWMARNVPNVLLVNFSNLKTNLESEIRRISNFLDFDMPEERWPSIVEHCSFQYMKKHAANVTPLGAVCSENGTDAFINKGVNGRWRDMLTSEDIVDYERMACEELGEECALWLAGGRGQSLPG